MKSVRIVVAAVFAFVAVAPLSSVGASPVAAVSSGPAVLSKAINAIVARPLLRHTLFGAEVYDLDAKRVVYAYNAEKFFKPASSTKTFTEGTALAVLGGDFRFTTPVYRTGPIDAKGVLHGNLVLVASGDPDLSQRIQPDGTLAFENEDHSYDGSADTKAVPGDPLAVLRSLAKQVAAAGLKSVSGRVLVDTSVFPDDGAESGTGAYLSSIVVNDNLIDVTVTPGKNVGDPVTFTVSPQTPYATFSSRAVTGAAHNENTLDMHDETDDFGNHLVTLVGSVPASDPPILYAYRVTDPRRFAEVALTTALRDAGVTIAQPQKDATFDRAAYAGSYTADDLVAKHVSLPLREDVRITLKVSDNLHASLMMYVIGAYAVKARTHVLRAGFAEEHKMLHDAGLDLSQATQSDGLGGEAYFTPAFEVSYLLWARTQKWFPDFYRGLPILGIDGTLYDIQTHAVARGRVHAKTGTWGIGDLLNGGGMVTSTALVGYTTARNGHRMVFALYLNRLQSRHGVDGGHIAGQLLGEMATQIYLHG